MSDPAAKPADKVQETADKLLATAEKCYRLAAGITDRQAVKRLLELAKECEDRAEVLSKETGRE